MIIETITTDSGLCVTMQDQTSHYFGGYYHVKVRAYCDILLIQNYFDNAVEFLKAGNVLGSSVRFERLLEKMAVMEPEIGLVRDQLMQTFRETTLKYLSVPGFERRFVISEYKRQTNKTQIRTSRAYFEAANVCHR